VFLVAFPTSQSLAQYQVNFLLGQKMLDEGDWEPLEEQSEFGVAATFGNENWPVQVAVDLLGSTDDGDFEGLDVEASTAEFAVGVRKIWNKNKAKPFFGGGLAFVNAELEIEGVSVDDDAVGAWVNGGVFWRLGSRFNLGVDVRVSRAEVSAFGVDVEAGGEHIALILGFGKAQ
jgi:hypothetical protein